MNTIEIKLYYIFLSNYVQIFGMIRGWTILISEVKVTLYDRGNYLVKTIEMKLCSAFWSKLLKCCLWTLLILKSKVKFILGKYWIQLVNSIWGRGIYTSFIHVLWNKLCQIQMILYCTEVRQSHIMWYFFLIVQKQTLGEMYDNVNIEPDL